MSDNNQENKNGKTLDKQQQLNVIKECSSNNNDESNKPKSRKKRQLINAPDNEECLDVNQEYVQCFE